MKSKEKRERYTQLNAEFQRIARRDKKVFLSEQCKKKKKRKTIEWEKLYKKGLHDQDNHDGVITHLEPDNPGMQSQLGFRKHHYDQS